MKTQIDCPYCDGMASLTKKPNDITYRKEAFKVVEHYYVCKECKEEFTTTATDAVTLVQAYNQYRERHHIPFLEEIIAIKEQYGLSATKMSEVLGLGINGYSNYEKGEIPTPAIGNLIRLAENPVMFKDMLEKAKGLFTEGMYKTTLNKVNFIINEQSKTTSFSYKLNLHHEVVSYTGFKRLNKNKIEGLFTAFLTKCKEDFNDRLKLNKLFFYIDFLNYKNTGYSITGLTYRAIQYGPVPTNYDSIFACLQNEELIMANWVKDKTGSAKEIFKTNAPFDKTIFSEEELSSIDLVIEKFKNTSSWDLVDLSHKEKGWLDLKADKGTISYQGYAFELSGV